MQQYEACRHLLPPAGLVAPSTTRYFDPQSGPMMSWIVSVLPFLEQQPLYDQIDFSKTALQSSDFQAFSRHAAVPSDAARGGFFADATLTAGKQFAKGKLCRLLEPVPRRLEPPLSRALCGTPQPIAMIHDGLEATLMLAEVRTWDQQDDLAGGLGLAVGTGANLLASFDMHDVSDPGGKERSSTRPPPLFPLPVS